MICALGWHRWNGGVCASCGKTRHCSVDRHHWRRESCEVCGSRKLGVARIVTLIDKIVRKRFDKLHPDWITELTDVGPVAIPYILREMKDLARTEADLLSPPFLDLRRALTEMGARGADLLQEAAAGFAQPVDAERSPESRVFDVARDVLSSWSTGCGKE